MIMETIPLKIGKAAIYKNKVIYVVLIMFCDTVLWLRILFFKVVDFL